MFKPRKKKCGPDGGLVRGFTHPVSPASSCVRAALRLAVSSLQKPDYPRSSEHPSRSIASATVTVPPRALSPPRATVVDPFGAPRSTWRPRSPIAQPPGSRPWVLSPTSPGLFRADLVTVRHGDSRGRDPCGPSQSSRGKSTPEESKSLLLGSGKPHLDTVRRAVSSEPRQPGYRHSPRESEDN